MARATRASVKTLTRPLGRRRATSSRRFSCGRGRTATAESVRARMRASPGTMTSSPSAERVLLGEGDTEELYLVLQVDAELLARAPPRFDHQRERVLGPRRVGVLDEVRVARRDLSATDAEAAQATLLEHASRGKLVVRVLEHAPERALVRRLRRLSLFLHA